ncbi:hypothetical protein SPBR_06028 [Sporothrix brasiliensis 5110]|uniref:Uncharacterized protein n=1 Tax=Sporothrix brasiliensis 5110 TaxID=1398154 RepID=A0A0C2J635_9PEZI|nr:uncharacterized protein SPBR_06028 [Sporothrix brasiliensis 5110]KIH94445.1 hypothetical protein SPBR_06028 [Sporothrix brasiliensis 5110]
MVSAALLGLTNYNSPLLRNAVPCALASLLVQYAVGLPSTFLVNPPSERFYDLTGALTNVAVVVLSLYLPRWRAEAQLVTASPGAALTLEPPHWRQAALSGAVALWAVRLGTYLFRRILREGKDSRFDAMRTKPAKLLFAWTAQALWIVLCQSPVTAVNAVGAPVVAASAAGPAHSSSVLPNNVLWSDMAGFGLFAFGLVFESITDYQKSSWAAAKHAKQHDEVFMGRGLFSVSRYPHYFGETTLWTGLAVAAAGVLTRAPVCVALGDIGVATALSVAAISPAFTAFVLLKLSGVPLSEPKYDRKYGKRADYQKWKRDTPKFFPKLF